VSGRNDDFMPGTVCGGKLDNVTIVGDDFEVEITFR
jgi:hypothetical protein